MNSWKPDRYLRFSDERTRPAVDLASRIAIDAPGSVIDLGCGPGNSTQVLRRRWPAARVCGLDSSKEMLSSAKKSYPDQEWIMADIKDWSAATPYDVVFSNAALQWIRNHEALIRHLFNQVAPGGALAFQIPSAAYLPVRSFIHQIAQDEAWAFQLEGARMALTMEEPHIYYDVLAPHASSVDIWETEYYHVMESSFAIVEWIAATGLRPFLEALDSEIKRKRFIELLSERVAEAYPVRNDGRVLFPFRRTFVIAYA